MNDSQRRHRSWLRYVGSFALVLAIAAVGVGGGMVYVGVSTSAQAEKNLQAALFTIHLVEQFVHDNGRWPASWDELHDLRFPSTTPSPLNGKMTAAYEWPNQAKHLEKCVAIDFQIDPAFVTSQDPREFAAIQPIGPSYEYRDDGYVQSLQQTLKAALEAKGQQNHSR